MMAYPAVVTAAGSSTRVVVAMTTSVTREDEQVTALPVEAIAPRSKPSAGTSAGRDPLAQ
jgi:hypothetical protein